MVMELLCVPLEEWISFASMCWAQCHLPDVLAFVRYAPHVRHLVLDIRCIGS